ncbi:MAG: HDOD domain-containing protein [Thermodesulfobacteriota bacterium]
MAEANQNRGKESEAGKRLKKTVEELVRLSTIPVSLKKILEVIENERASHKDLVSAIEHDQSLASRIVSMANTAFYGYAREVKDIQTAVTILGFNMVRNLAISTSLFKLNGNHGAMADKLRKLWTHSYEVAVASALIAERTGLAKKDEAFLSGLIADIGRVILYQIYGEVYMKVSNYGREGLLIREEEAFGGDHQMVGAWFLNHYKFSKECVISLKEHHTPEKFLSDYRSGSLQLIAIVYIADIITTRNREGFEFDLSRSASHEEIMEAIYLDEAGAKEIEDIMANMEDSISGFYAAG